MVKLYPDFREFLESLNSAKVEYLVLGGYAVIHYGYRRTTNDLDVWIATTPRNARRVAAVIRAFFGLSAEALRPKDFEDRGRIFMFGREPARIDVLTDPSGIDFQKCYKSRNVVDWDGVPVPLISLADLKKNKLASSRAKDLADVEKLPAMLERLAPKRRSIKRRNRK